MHHLFLTVIDSGLLPYDKGSNSRTGSSTAQRHIAQDSRNETSIFPLD